MGIFHYDDEYNNEKNISVNIKLPKSCYYPGETLEGIIILQIKNNKMSPIFDSPKAVIKIIECQQYEIRAEESVISENIKKEIISKTYHFSRYKGADLSIPLKLKFKFDIPENIHPTLIAKNKLIFIKHLLCVEFPYMECKKTNIIIIQNKRIFKKNNGLLKQPVEKFNEIKKGKVFGKKSKIAYLFKTQKNSYAYNELVPYEIIINCSELEVGLKSLEVSIYRSVYCGNSKEIINNCFSETDKIVSNFYDILKNKDKIHKICGHLIFPNSSEYFSVNPMNIYNYFNEKTLDNVNMSFADIELYPSCFGSKISCGYFLRLKISYNSFVISDELISIPIEFYTPLNIKDEDDNKEKEEFSYEINNINENDNDISDEEITFHSDTRNDETPSGNEKIDSYNDYFIIQKSDFYDLLSDEKK